MTDFEKSVILKVCERKGIAMRTYNRQANRFLRPKRDSITSLDQIRKNLRSLSITEAILNQGLVVSLKERTRRRGRTGVSR